MVPVGRILAVFAVALAGAQPAAVNGFVRDRTNGEPLAYANVVIDGTGLGAATSERGYFYIGQIPAGRYELSASYVGYQTVKRQIELGPGQVLSLVLELPRAAVELGEVRVSAERARFEREVEISATRLETRSLLSLPKLGGEVDILRTIQLLPGVVMTSDFSNRLYIRGGSPDQNLILLDGISLYNPSHLFGIFSPFIAEAVADATLLAGGFPAQYGGRLSSVLDVVTREGNSKRFSADGSVSILAARAVAEGPIPDGSFLVAARRTYLPDLILAGLGVEGLGYYFYDVMGKVNYVRTPDSRLTLAGISAEDVLSFWDPENRQALDSKLRWGNNGVSLRWNRVFTPILYGEVLAAWSNFRSRFDVDFGADANAKFKSDLMDWTLKADLTWYLADAHTAQLGFDAKSVGNVAQFNYDTIEVVHRDTLIPLALYAEDKWELLTERLFVRPGLRLAFDPYRSRFEPEPRLGAKFRPGKNTAVNAAIGRFTQPTVVLNSTEALFSIYDVWVSVPRKYRLPSALHYIAGVEHWFSEDAFGSVELYYKDFSHLLETRYGDFFTPPDSLLVADGYSLGLELMLRKTEGWIHGWVSYSLAWTERQVGNERFHPHYDRRHSLNIVATLPGLYRGIDLSARWTLGTGLPYAGVVGYGHRYEYYPHEHGYHWHWMFEYGERDAFRYPVYHRLDLGLSKVWRLRWGELRGFLDVINVYNTKNVLLYYWERTADERPVRKSIGMIPILPTLGVSVRF